MANATPTPLAGTVCILHVKVRPNARTSLLVQAEDGRWQAQLRSSPVDGKANAELIALVAAHFGCAKSKVSIAGGATSRTKRVRVAG